MATRPHRAGLAADELPPAAARAVRRALAARESAYSDEVQRLLDAGLALMVQGERSPRVADIVRRAGLSNQAFYRHFSSKDELIAAVVDAGAHRLEGYLRRQVEKATTAEEQLAAWVRGVLSQSRPAVAAPTRAAMASFRMLAPDNQQLRMPRPGIGLLVEILERLHSTDPERDANVVALAAFGLLDQLLWETPGTDRDIEHLVAFCTAAVSR